MVQLGLYTAAIRLPFLPTRAGLGSLVVDTNPGLRTVTDPYGGEELVAMPALKLDAALVHMNRADEKGNAQFLGPDPYFDDLFCAAADEAYVSCEQIVPTEELTKAAHPVTVRISRMLVTGVVEAPNGAHFTSCVPDYGRDEAFQRAYVEAAGDPDQWAAFSRALPRRRRGRLPARGCRVRGGKGSVMPVTDTAVTARRADRAEACVIACAEAFRGDGEILAAPIGLIPIVAARLARHTFEPDLLLTDGEAHVVQGTWPVGAPAPGPVESWLPYRTVFDVVWRGDRHVMMTPSQIDSFGNANISAIGSHAKPKAQLLGARGAPGNAVSHPTSYWIPKHSARVFTATVDMVAGVGWDNAAKAGPAATRYMELRRVVSNLASFDWDPGSRRHAAALRPPGRDGGRGHRGDRIRSRYRR